VAGATLQEIVYYLVNDITGSFMLLPCRAVYGRDDCYGTGSE
jgi:hypothetical protein